MLRLPAALLAIAALAAHALLWGRASLQPVFGGPAGILLLFALSAASIPVHEALHVAGYRLLGGAPRGVVGVTVQGLMAYAYCAVPLPARAYRASIALPGAVLGLLPLAAGLALGRAWPTAFGAFALAAAMADARVLWALRRIPGRALVLFRPERAAYEISPAAPPA
jgi:hypothetical protein